jgi:hypothetical protein
MLVFKLQGRKQNLIYLIYFHSIELFATLERNYFLKILQKPVSDFKYSFYGLEI